MRKPDNPAILTPEEYGALTDRKFTAIIYPDATNYTVPCDMILENILPNSGYFPQWFYIKHDRDKNEDGTLKKVHYHIIVTKTNPATIKTVAKQLGIPQNYIQRVQNFKSMVAYLTHDEQQDKIQYSKDEIITNCSEIVNKAYSVDTDADMGREIIDYIINNRITSITDLSVWAANSGYYSAYRRGFAIFSCLVREQGSGRG